MARLQQFSVDSSGQTLTQTTTPSREIQNLSPIKLGVIRAIPMITFISAIGIVIMTYCFLFVMKRKNEIHPSHQQSLCGQADLRSSNNSNYQNELVSESRPAHCKPEFFTPTLSRNSAM